MKKKLVTKLICASLCAAMIGTTVPADALTVYAAEKAETMTEAETETEADEESEEEAEQETSEAVVEEKEVKEIVDNKANSEEYAGPTINYDTNSEDPGAVTIYYTKETDGSVKIKGSWVSDWSDFIDLEKDGDIWLVTVPTSKIGKDKSVEYGFAIGANGEWDKDDSNPNTNGNCQIKRNPEINADGAVTLYYYPEHKNYPENVVLKYKGKDGEYKSADMQLDAVNTAVYSVTLTDLASGDYDYYFDVDGKKVQDTNNANIGKFTAKSYPKKDESVVSPVAGKGEATFYFYGPTNTKVQLAGDMTGWQGGAKDLEYNEDTGYWSVTVPMAVGSYGYKFIVDGNWMPDPLNTKTVEGSDNSLCEVKEASDEKNPVIDGNKVKFVYNNKDAESVSLAGTMNGWTPGVDLFTKTEDGKWELTLEDVNAGEYQYKIVVGKDGWTTDPLNSNTTPDGNNLFCIAGLAGEKVDAKIGGSVELPKKLLYWNEDGTKVEKAVSYELNAKNEEVNKSVKLTAKDGTTTLELSKDFSAEVKTFDIVAVDADGNKAKFDINVVANLYKYTVYWYSHTERNTEDCGLWIWENNGGNGSMYPFTDEETIDGKVWKKAVIELPFTDMGIIATASDTKWAWQDNTHNFKNSAKEEETVIYMVDGDSKNYSEAPEIKKQQGRYLVLEYEREDGKEADTNLYTWNSGFGGEVWVPFLKNEDADTYAATVPVKPGVTSISFCVTREEDGNKWADKDGGDNLVKLPEEQSVVRAKYQDGKVTYVYPNNTGYETDIKNKVIHFFYRDDESFMKANAATLADVKVEIDGKAYAMKYDSKNGRYTYDYKITKLENHDFLYRYIVKEDKDSEISYLTDKFNSKTKEDNGNKYSVVEYKKLNLELKASVYNTKMDYNENNVLSLKLADVKKANDKKDKDDAKDSEIVEVAEAYANLSALGGASRVAIEPELMELTIAVRDNVSAGKKNIPVTVIDTYGNNYTATATVEVTKRNKGNDFDWDEAVVYFAVTDRFYDGNTSNNGAGYNTDKETGSLSYHGGDFAGLTQKLDYLDDLGVNTIWITPIVANDMEDGLSTDLAGTKSWGYHGYWTSDFTKLDSHLGTKEELEKLISEAHNRNMKIMVDVVLNHAGYGTEDFFNSKVEGDMIRTDEQKVNGSDILNSLAGLPDFLTENKEVRDLLVAWQTQWVKDLDIDYYRIDTVKHVDNVTWSAFRNELAKIDPKFKIIGEWSGAGYATETGMLGTGRMDSLLDFDFNDQSQKFVTGGLEEVENFMRSRNAAINNTQTMGQFMSSHDEDGLLYKLINQNGISEADATELFKVAAALQITAKGQPVVYYGEELGQFGADNYPYQTNRYDFDWSAIKDDNAMLNHYKKLLSIREKNLELFAKGTRNTIEVSNDGKYDVFERSYNGSKVYVALNIADTAKTVSFKVDAQKNGLYEDLYSGKYYAVNSNGTITVDIPAAKNGGTIILQAAKNTKTINMTKASVKLEKTSVKYAVDAEGKPVAQTPSVTFVKVNGKTVDPSCYEVSYEDNTNVGTAKVIITAKDNSGYAGTIVKTFKITGTSLSSVAKINVKSIEKLTFDPVVANSEAGIVQAKPELTAKAGYTLKEGVDYTVEYKNNKKAGTATIIFKGMGAYTGTVTREFKINALKLDGENTKLVVLVKNDKVEYSAKGSKLEMTVLYNGVELGSKDYSVVCSNNKALTDEKTKKKPVATINFKGNYAGKVTRNFEITTANLANMTAKAKDIVYTAKAGKYMSAPVIKDANGSILKNGVDYDKNVIYTYTANTTVKVNGAEVVKKADEVVDTKDIIPYGTIIRATVNAKAGSRYTGSISCTYKLAKADISKMSGSINAKTYTGREITLTAKDFANTKLGKTQLSLVTSENEDGYMITSYINNVNKGTAKVVLKGTGIYGGTKKMNFKINAKKTK